MDAAAAWARDASQTRHGEGASRASGGAVGTGGPGGGTGGSRSYRLSTRHHGDGDRGAAGRSSPEGPPGTPRGMVQGRGDASERVEAPTPAEPQPRGPALLCLLGQTTAVFEHEGALWAADLRAMRVELVRRRLVKELGSGGAAVQRLLRPVVVERQREQVKVLHEARGALQGLGVELEAFGEDAVVVRGVPASWGGGAGTTPCRGLVDQVSAWARLWGDSRCREIEVRGPRRGLPRGCRRGDIAGGSDRSRATGAARQAVDGRAGRGRRGVAARGDRGASPMG